MKSPKKVHGLFVGSHSAVPSRRHWGDEDGGMVKLHVVEVGANGEITNPRGDRYDLDRSPYDGVIFSAYWKSGDALPHTYGWSVQYRDVFSVELSDAEKMYKFLRRVRNVELPIHPATFGQWAVLTAKALGISKVVEERQHNGSSYSENEHRILDGEQGQLAIDREIERVRLAQKEMAA